MKPDPILIKTLKSELSRPHNPSDLTTLEHLFRPYTWGCSRVSLRPVIKAESQSARP